MGARRQRLTPSGVVIQSVRMPVGGGDVRGAVWQRLHSRSVGTQSQKGWKARDTGRELRFETATSLGSILSKARS
eukprot:scaffold118551_cov57-Phaeocystis_antarctica.AAC.2